ncbi:MAG: S-ribosylhomocysteine lyase [Clostridiales bacterium]|nr:S-ribosylhomocysteine lyase [Clostridiales bacterium]
MEKIASFQVDHRYIGVGMYISRVDTDIITYDIRMVKPNGGEYLETSAMHTIEHLFATFARNTEYKDRVVYVGPMGCRTGFYLLLRGMTHDEAIKLVRDSFSFISTYEGEIPGSSEIECGNYKEHDLEGAKASIEELLIKIEEYKAEMLDYSWHNKQQ